MNIFLLIYYYLLCRPVQSIIPEKTTTLFKSKVPKRGTLFRVALTSG